MGEDWTLLNIDKQKRLYYGKYGSSSFWKSLIDLLLHEDPKKSWAGDRLIFFGDCTSDVPAGILKDEEPDSMIAMFAPGRESLLLDTWKKEYVDTCILRNLCSHEYIRADLFPYQSSDEFDLEKVPHIGLTEALLEAIMWSCRRGSWAGGRFDIVDRSIIEGASEWKDVTEPALLNHYHNDYYSSSWSPYKCHCNQCKKVKELRHKQSLARNDVSKREATPTRPFTARGDLHSVSSGTTGTSFVIEKNHLSKIEGLPAELLDHIFGYLELHHLVPCAATSKQFSVKPTIILYTIVTLHYEREMDVLLKALIRRPGLAGCIKSLSVVTLAHWESLQSAHEILKKLPALQSLEFSPCWFSYGDLAYWEYPFMLRSLTWGLKDDAAFKRLSGFQPNAQIKVIPPCYSLPESFGGESEDEDKD